MDELTTMEWLKSLQVGDKVIVTYWQYTDTTMKEAEVEKITPKGFIRVDGNLFYPNDGSLRRSGWLGGSIRDPKDPEVRKAFSQYLDEAYIRVILQKMHHQSNLTLDKAQAVAKIMGW